VHRLLGQEQQDRGAHVTARCPTATTAATTSRAARATTAATGAELATAATLAVVGAVGAEARYTRTETGATRAEDSTLGAEATAATATAATASAAGLVVVRTELVVVPTAAPHGSGGEVDGELCLGAGAEGCRALPAGLVEGCVSHRGSPEIGACLRHGLALGRYAGPWRFPHAMIRAFCCIDTLTIYL